jgi:hypothetical protein
MLIPNWLQCKQDLCSRLEKNHSALKIILKTKDEVEHLGNWIEHHVGIVGPENIVIFDNESTLDEVFSVYREHPDIAVVRYSGAVDNLHHLRIFPELYASLRASCLYYTVIDTDERLVLVENDKYWRDNSVLHFLKGGDPCTSYPGFWLQNVLGYRDRFVFDCYDNVVSGLKWGKPVVSGVADLPKFLNHNTHFDRSKFAPLRTNLFILHLNKLTPKQRIEANIRKMKSLGLLPTDASVQSIAEIDPISFREGNPRNYLREIQNLSRLPPDFGERQSGPLGRGELTLVDGQILFGAEDQRVLLNNLLRLPESWAHKAL